MMFKETKLPGAYVIDLEPNKDERGFFARTWCKTEFSSQGLNNNLVQCNISYNNKAGTIRGMHFQAPPFEEVKVVRCIRGSIFDVIIDIRPQSKTYLQWAAFELSAENRKMLYIPEGFAHGFQTLENDTEVFYQMSEYYHSTSAKGLRWDDPTFNITWPITNGIILSDKDNSYKGFYNEESRSDRS